MSDEIAMRGAERIAQRGQGGSMLAHEAIPELIRLLRAVADGTVSASEALARVPEVDNPGQVPKTYWSAVTRLELEAEHGLGVGADEDFWRWTASEFRKLADRLEG
jgi:hypothetical protein